ncbi:hypothetical protein A1Q2_06832 [Trichosporon asahii var. asahii CBS 8904]|uniref:Zn(2)-C6 fungal-type domain-containing protein n=1 Tax=Trichosporon asahii var. asahii (strain CBS 8904) TaxID=1220162 RepID=K1VI90_TRIAC|nr:hypothetical protein A1Q2_06832 [Trichosporon asahii var. asahii CBS 8904]
MTPEYYNHWAGSGVGRPVAQTLPGVGTPQATPPSYRPIYSPAGAPPPVAEGTSPTGSDPKKKRRRRADGSPGAEEKRTKTGRACDACRSKKIRCDILPSDGSDAQPICAHCKQYNIECTFFLPITETRFKKRRAANDDQNSAKTNGQTPPSAGPGRPPGPGSILSLVHPTAPTRSFEAYDIANHQNWEVSKDDEGKIKVRAFATGDEENSEKRRRLANHGLDENIMTNLINSYYEYDHQFLPIIPRDEFIASGKPHPFLLYCMCAVASCKSDFPRSVFTRMRGMVNGLLRANEIMSNPTIEHIQGLLIISPVGDLHAQPAAGTATAAAMRLGCAVRMAQELGLHRETKPPSNPTAADIAQLELKRRIWAACVYMDKWYAAHLGTMQQVDVHDCDVLVPSPYKIDPSVESSKWEIDPPLAHIGESMKLALLVGRVLKLVYGPAGMHHCTDEQLKALNTDLRQWAIDLPQVLRFKGRESSALAGLLHFQYLSAMFLFWRPFLRVVHPPPAHIKTILDLRSWHELVRGSKTALEWLDSHTHALDTIYFYAYSATSCALIQYHRWARKREQEALDTLKLVRDLVRRWEEAFNPDQMSMRRKSCETMNLLYEAALKTNPVENDTRSEASGTGSSGAVTTTSVERPAFGHRRGTSNINPNIEDLGNVEGEGPTQVSYRAAAERASVFDDAGDFDFFLPRRYPR